MNEMIDKLVDNLFLDYPHTTKNDRYRDALAENIESRIQELHTQTESEIAIMKTIVNEYETMEKALAHIQVTLDDLNQDNRIEFKTLKKKIRTIQRLSYMCCISFIVGLAALIMGVTSFLIYRESLHIWMILIWLLFLWGITFFCYRKLKKEMTYSPSLDEEGYQYIVKLKDGYAKKLWNSSAIVIGVLSYVIFYIINLSTIIHLNHTEIYRQVLMIANFIEIVCYLFLKNYVLDRLLNRFYPLSNQKDYWKRFNRFTGISALYWIVIDATLLIFHEHLYYFNLFMIAMVAYGISVLVYNLTYRKKIFFSIPSVNRKKIVVYCIIGSLLLGYYSMNKDNWMLQPYITTVQPCEYVKDDITYDEETGIYTITSDKEDFKVLQLTDIHLGGSGYSTIKDYKALQACYKLIQDTKPDLVVVTGDLVFPLGIMSFSFNNRTPMMQFASFMRNVGIPWTFLYGNHDTEGLASSSAADINELFKSMSYKTSGNFLYPYVQPDITGRNNQLIEIRRKDGSLNQALFLLDSNDYTGEGLNDYDYIHDDEVAWYKEMVEQLNEEEGRTVSSMCFFHMPLQEYRTAYELYEAGSDEVQYYFGENGESMIDKVCCSKYPSKLFDTALELKSTKAMFCGHDHYNNLSVDYKGIRLTYGMSIDYLAMPGIENDTKQRGATLIVLHNDESFDITQKPFGEKRVKLGMK